MNIFKKIAEAWAEYKKDLETERIYTREIQSNCQHDWTQVRSGAFDVLKNNYDVCRKCRKVIDL